MGVFDDPVVKLSSYLGNSPVRHKNRSGGKKVQEDTGYKLYGARWIILALSSGSYFLSSWISYTVPTDEDTLTSYFGATDNCLNNVFAYFLLGNALGTLLEPLIDSSCGIRNLCINSAAVLVFGGSLCYFGSHNLKFEQYGLIFVGVSQGIVQCPLAKICGTWFCPNGRTLATTVALTMNNFGIGVAYILPGLYMDGLEGFTTLRKYLLFASCGILVATILFFEEFPPVSPSISAELMKRDMRERLRPSGFIESIQFLGHYWMNAFSLFKVPGFFSIISISIGDVIVAYMSTLYLTDTLQTDYKDDDFLRTMVGIGYYVPSVFVASAAASLIDYFKTKHAEATYLTSLHAGCLMTIFSCGMILMALYDAPENSARNSFILYLIMLGNLMALLDGISADGAVEICYGCGLDNGHGIENMVITLQMFLGNAISGLLMVGVPDNLMQTYLYPDYTYAYAISAAVAVLMYIPLITFRGNFRRVKADMKLDKNEATQRLLSPNTNSV